MPRRSFKQAKPWSLRAKPQAVQQTEALLDIRSTSRLMRWRYRILVLMWLMILLAITIVASMVLTLEPAGAPVSVGQIISMIVGILIFAVVCGVLQSCLGQIAKWWFRKKVIAVRGHLCIHCFYDLSARPREIDTCPECGLNAPRRECVRLWCKLLRSRF